MFYSIFFNIMLVRFIYKVVADSFSLLYNMICLFSIDKHLHLVQVFSCNIQTFICLVVYYCLLR